MADGEVKPIWRSARRVAVLIVTLVAVIVAVNSAVGYVAYSNAAEDALTHVDAIVVLGGEHDGREHYGLTLARQGFASTVLLSNPYRAADRVMKRMCLPRNDGVEVMCLRPDPLTTRGEALMTRRLAIERHWHKILIVSWRYHLPRARIVFDQCLSGMDVSVTAKAVARDYVLPVWYWQYIYFYQSAGIAKALTTDHC